VPETMQCDEHGETSKAYVCAHLEGEDTGLGFNRNEPSEENPFPDAWCDACEVIRAEYNGWDDVPDGMCKIVLFCSECYERARIRNTRPSVTFDDLADLRWKCGSCEEWHSGPVLDISFTKPYYWEAGWDEGSIWVASDDEAPRTLSSTFLTEDYCAIDGEFFFVRGLIHLPILGAAETFRWGVWGALSRANFEKLLRMENDPERTDLDPMFSWLSTCISGYPDTLSLRMYAHIQEPGTVPYFRLERCDRPLAQEYHHGITPERVREITLRSLPALEQ
jgi:hypothetical protein